MTTRYGNSAALQADRIQAERFSVLMAHGMGDSVIVDCGAIQRIKSVSRDKVPGMVTLWDTLMARYQQAPDRMRSTVAGLLLMAGADRESIQRGQP